MVILGCHNIVSSADFQERHKRSPKHFTRHGPLGFYPLFWEIATTTESSYSKQAQELKKHGITGIHNRKLSASAICQARQKIKASAFDEASQTVIDCAGNDQDNFLYWNGFQIIGGDATSAWLDNPQYQAIIDYLN